MSLDRQDLKRVQPFATNIPGDLNRLVQKENIYILVVVEAVLPVETNENDAFRLS